VRSRGEFELRQTCDIFDCIWNGGSKHAYLG
jgi:hypothetical protein